MNAKDYANYWVPACKNLFDERMYRLGDGQEEIYSWASQLETALGIGNLTAYWQRTAREDYPMSTELRELLTKLAGPHGKTVLKTYRIQKGLEK